MDIGPKINNSLSLVESWVENHSYKGYDPGDGLNSFLRPLAFGNSLLERILLQGVWKSPINLRPILGVKPMESTKGRGYMAWGYLIKYSTTNNETDKIKATTCLDWLVDNRASGQKVGSAWGNHFDFITRSGKNPAGSPIIVWTSLIGLAFLKAYEDLGDDRYIAIAQDICRWILALPRDRTEHGNCLSYVPFAQSSIHNSNMLGAAMLACTWKYTKEPELIDAARSAILYSCHRQRQDGAWWYGEESKYHWNDNFHTGYNLDSLKRYILATGDDKFHKNYIRGLHYYKNTFFTEDGKPRYYENSLYPIDIQCASQSIDTLALCSEDDPSCLAISEKVAEWTIDNMQDSQGFFYYRKYPLMKARTPYIHWGQATMFKALANLKLKMDI